MWFHNYPGWLDAKPFTFPWLCSACFFPTFLVALFTIHLCNLDGTLFLDIACIAQDDPEQKAKGIDSLGAVLDRSQKMLVLLDDVVEFAPRALFDLIVGKAKLDVHFGSRNVTETTPLYKDGARTSLERLRRRKWPERGASHVSDQTR